MRNYGTIPTPFWFEPSLDTASLSAKFLSVYLLTGPHTTMLGCFRIPASYIAEDVKVLTVEKVIEGFKELAELGFLTYDTNNSWVCLHRFLEWNPIENPNQGKHMERLFNQVPSQSTVLKPLIACLLSQTHLDKGFRYRLETLSKLFRNQEQEQEDFKHVVVGDEGQPPSSAIDDEYTNSITTLKNSSLYQFSDGRRSETLSSNEEKTNLAIPLYDGSTFIPSATQIHHWQTLYPAIDVKQELRQIRAWNEANPTERKPRTQILRHINAWLAKEQRESRRQQAPPLFSKTSLAARGLSPTLAHNLQVGEAWLRNSTKSENVKQPETDHATK